ncbi:hypothetical protein QTP88_000969 [Uroleucon formosanum]
MTSMNLSAINNRIMTLGEYFGKVVDMCVNVTRKMTVTRCSDVNTTVLALLDQINERIDHYYMIMGDSPGKKNKRAILGFMGDLQKQLYGVLNEEDGARLDAQIFELNASRERAIQISKDQTSVIKSNIDILNTTINNFNKDKNVLNDNFERISKQINNINELLTDVEVEELVSQQIMMYTLMQSHVLFEIDLLGEIITAAQAGVIHSSILTPKDILNQLRQIKGDMPLDNEFPAELNLGGAMKMLNMGKLVSMYRDKILVFIIRFPLVYNVNFTLYHLISLPVNRDNSSTITLIKTNDPYLAISKNYEKYVGFNEVDMQECQQTSDFVLCEGSKNIYNRHEKTMCDIQLIMKPEKVPENCVVQYKTESEDVFKKLKYKNSWLYSTKLSQLIIDCEKEINPLTIEIRGIGLLSLREDCKDRYKFIIMDFEFSMCNRTNIVLISGAMSNSLDRYRVIKLQGNPLLLTALHQVKGMTLSMINKALDQCIKYLGDKTDTLYPLLDQYRESLFSTNRNLSVRNIKNYLDKGNTEAILIFWGGSTDKIIMERMGLGHYQMLEIFASDKYNNQEFFLHLRNMSTKEIIISEGIGYVNKRGNLLNLGEAHHLLCSKNHKFTYLHDPIVKMPLTTEQRKMLLSESLAVKLFFLNKKRKRNPVHQIYKDRFEFGEFHHLYTQLRADDNLFHSYTRMTTGTFDYIKEAIEHECYHITTNFKVPISVEERLLITLR